MGLAESLTTPVCSPDGEGSTGAERLGRRTSEGVEVAGVVHRLWSSVPRMECFEAVLTRDGVGVVVVDVVEVDGVLVEAASGAVVDLVCLVVVPGLPALDPLPA